MSSNNQSENNAAEQIVKQIVQQSDQGDSDELIPVTILTGFLGSGKTTLFSDHGFRIAVIENEFGEVGIDDGLVIRAQEEIFEVNNGCLCCTVREDLIKILRKLIQYKNKFDYVIIETTGLALPGPVVQTFFVEPDMVDHYALDGVVTMVDAKHIMLHLSPSKDSKEQEEKNETIQQIAFADRIIVNKVDLVSKEELQKVKEMIKEINVFCQIQEASFGKINLDFVLGIEAFELNNILQMDPKFLEQSNKQEQQHHHHHKEGDHSHSKEHSHEHHHEHSHKKEEEEKEHHHHHHKGHDPKVKSFGFETTHKFNYDAFSEWITELLQAKGADLYRMKGIIFMSNRDKPLVFQGVHQCLDSGLIEANSSVTSSKIVFIGKNLDRKEFYESFMACTEDAILKNNGQVIRKRYELPQQEEEKEEEEESETTEQSSEEPATKKQKTE